MYDTLGEYNQAKELHEKALIISKKIFGEDHADVATSYQQLGISVQSVWENTIKPKNFTKKHWQLAKRYFGEDHADVATSY